MDRCEIDPELRDAVLEPFITAVTTSLREMAATEAAPRDAYQAASCGTVGEVNAVLDLKFATPGLLVLGFPRPTAEDLARRMLAEVTPDVDESVVRDCAGEIANVTAGQAKALLHGTAYHITFATPRIIQGAGQEVRPLDSGRCLVVEFGSEAGDFSMQVVVPT